MTLLPTSRPSEGWLLQVTIQAARADDTRWNEQRTALPSVSLPGMEAASAFGKEVVAALRNTRGQASCRTLESDRRGTMALNKKGSRHITVDGIEYCWRIRRKPSCMQGLCWTPMTYAVETANGNESGTSLVVTSSQARPSNCVGAEAVPIRPAQVAASIREGTGPRLGTNPCRVSIPARPIRRIHRPAMRQSEEGRPISVELPQRLQAWFAEHEEHLQSCGITGAVQQSPEDGRTKTSTWMTLETDDYIAVLIVWSSGEAEFEYGDVATGQIRPEHRELRTFQDLLDAIETIHEWIRTKGERSLGG